MKLLFIAQAPLQRELGGPKVVLELAEAIRTLNHQALVVGPLEIEEYLKDNGLPIQHLYAKNISTFLNNLPDRFDIVDADANFLYDYVPHRNKGFALVARSVLFGPHFLEIRIPDRKSFGSHLKNYARNFFSPTDSVQSRVDKFYSSLDNADLINVSNHRDVEVLLQKGYSRKKILNIPYGLFDSKRRRLQSTLDRSKLDNHIVFVGTFDFRKGCLDTPQIFEKIKASVPDAQLTLLGARGLFEKEKEMLRFFKPHLRNCVHIIPTFKEETLPDLLTRFKIAIFPSYVEGFGFSVIENMAAGIPVIAYDSPGPSSILREKYLIKPGNWQAMAEMVISYLNDNIKLQNASLEVIEDSKKYNWNEIASYTLTEYSKVLCSAKKNTNDFTS